MRSAREALTASSRAPLLSALGVVTISFSLFAFGLFGLVAINIRKALDEVSERVEIRAFLSDSADIEGVAAAMKDVGEFPEVNRVDYVSKEQALERAHPERMDKGGEALESALEMVLLLDEIGAP